MTKHKGILICSAISVVIGVVIGVTAGFYGEALHFAEEFRAEHYLYVIPFLGLAGTLILFLYNRISPQSEQGLNLAIAYNMGNVNTQGKIRDMGKIRKTGKYPKSYALLKLLTNWVMLFFGASTGKEGSFAAFGASIGDYSARIFKSRRYSRVLLISGVAAAVSALFGTPIGGVFFALEFTAAGIMSYSALIPASIASFTAFLFARLCGFTAFSHHVTADITFDAKTVVLFVICALIFGLVGRFFTYALHKSHDFYRNRIKRRYLAMFIIGTVMAGVFILVGKGRYGGTGALILSTLFDNGDFYMYDFALKFVFTIICITIGFSGGEMMPLLTIGATLGAATATVCGLPVGLMAAVGCVAVYGSATNTLIAPIFIGIEMFGTDATLCIAVACIIAYAVNGNTSVYSLQGNLNQWGYGIFKLNEQSPRR